MGVRESGRDGSEEENNAGSGSRGREERRQWEQERKQRKRLRTREQAPRKQHEGDVPPKGLRPREGGGRAKGMEV